MDEAGTWVWIHAGEHRAINLRHVTDVEFEQGPVRAAHLYLTADGAKRAADLGRELEAARERLDEAFAR